MHAMALHIQTFYHMKSLKFNKPKCTRGDASVQHIHAHDWNNWCCVASCNKWWMFFLLLKKNWLWCWEDAVHLETMVWLCFFPFERKNALRQWQSYKIDRRKKNIEQERNHNFWHGSKNLILFNIWIYGFNFFLSLSTFDNVDR